MPSGFQTFYANGNIALDLTDRTARLRGIVSIAANTTSTITVSKAAGESIFAFMLTDGATTYGGCGVNQSTNVITYNISGSSGGTLYHGVF